MINKPINLAHGALFDAFGRLRTSNPVTLSDTQFEYLPRTWSISQYDQWERVLTGGGTVTHLPNDSACGLNVGTASGDKVVSQQHIFNRYQPAKSQLVYCTALYTPIKNRRFRQGYFSARDGVFFQMTSFASSWGLRTSTSGAAIDTTILQSEWNIDRFDGSKANGGLNPSGITINFDKAQIPFIDLQWLSLGTVRFGFEVDGISYYCHAIHNVNRISGSPYMRTANLPVRYEVENIGTVASSGTMKQICCAVVSEGGFEIERGEISFASNDGAGVNVGNTVYSSVLNVRPKTLVNSLNCSGYLEPLRVFASADTNDIDWLLLLNPTFTGGAHSWVSSGTNNLMEYDLTRTGTVPTLTGQILSGGEARAGGGSSPSIPTISALLSRLLLGNNIDFTAQDMISVVAKARAATTVVHASVDCREFK